MKKVFKDYLEIYVGSRGLIEDVSIKSFEDIESELKEKSDENCKWIEEDDEMDEDYKDELLGYWDSGIDINGDYYLGLGDEEMKIYINMKSDKFIEWKEKNKINVEMDFNKLEYNIIRELID